MCLAASTGWWAGKSQRLVEIARGGLSERVVSSTVASVVGKMAFRNIKRSRDAAIVAGDTV